MEGMEVDSPSSKRPCFGTSSDGTESVTFQSSPREGHSIRRQASSPFQPVDWEDVHRQGDREDGDMDEQVKQVDCDSSRKGPLLHTIRRAGSEPLRPWLASLPEEGKTDNAKPLVTGRNNFLLTGPGRGKPFITGRDDSVLTGPGRENPVPSGPPWSPGGRPLTKPAAFGREQPSFASNRSSESNASVGSKRGIGEVEGSAAGREVSGTAVSGVSHEGQSARMTSSTPRGDVSPGAKHRRIEEEASSSSGDEEGGMSDLEKERSALDQNEGAGKVSSLRGAGSPPRGAGSPRNKGTNVFSKMGQMAPSGAASSRALGSSIESATLDLAGGGRRQVIFPPVPGGMKRSGSRVDLTEEKRSGGGGVPLFELLTRGMPPPVVQENSSGASVRSENNSQGGSRNSKERTEQQRKEFESLPPSLRMNLFPSHTDSALSGLETSDRRASERRVLDQRDVDRMLKQGPLGPGFKARPSSPGFGGGVWGPNSTSARFVLPNGSRREKAASDSVLPGATVTDDTMPEVESPKTLQSVSITSEWCWCSDSCVV
jgi:hypothetical protein